MGKKIRMKWRKLDIEPEDETNVQEKSSNHSSDYTKVIDISVGVWLKSNQINI